MAFDNPTRNRLARLVSDCRRLLTDEFSIQLQQHYGIQPDGQIIPLEQLSHLDDKQRGVAAMLRERISHIASGLTEEKRPAGAAVDRLLREQAFTVLNRFAALRMCEERELVQECVRGGLHSRGFKVFLQIAGSGLGDTWLRYRTFLYLLFDEISVDLGLLFDRFSPFGLLFPREAALEELFRLLNTPDLQSIWAEDETIGWIYQYFNSKEERQAMRKASAAPRNSRELAVRNQFFTPRYVVEFLTDNTLGRTWYEMRQGQTRLTEQCRYLVRRPHEVFLQPGELAPEPPPNQDDLSQEELLRQPHHISFRPKKDPRDLKILDPACGSGHFLLYAFDLLQTIYEEAWEDESMPAEEASGTLLRHDYPDREKLLLTIPELILRHNLHGIDIDPRAVQIAALALWLRAQRAWKEQLIKPEERPRIRKSHIVCAEPMPGEKQMLREFTTELQPPLLGQIVERIFDRMQLAGEAGSLLKIEEEIQESISQAKEQWQRMYERARDKFGNQMLFSQREMDDLRLDPQLMLGLFDVSQISDAEFWETVEERILAALREYAERSSNGHTLSRRMFADDAAKGFAFIDLCRKRYDVVLMNPPFGATNSSCSPYLSHNYSKTAGNLACTFFERAVNLSSNAKIGAIVDIAIMIRSSYSTFRYDILYGHSMLTTLCLLGWDVLDDANVETCFFTADTTSKIINHHTFCFDIRNLPEKKEVIQDQILKMSFIFADQNSFLSLPNGVPAFYLPLSFRKIFKKSSTIDPTIFEVCTGLSSGDNLRFYKLLWEIPAKHIGITWKHLSNGGEYSPFYRQWCDLINWKLDGSIIKSNQGAFIRNESKYFKKGLTYGKRGKYLSVQFHNSERIITNEGQGIFCLNNDNLVLYCAIFNSSVYQVLINTYCGQHKENGYVKLLPTLKIGTLNRKRLIDITIEAQKIIKFLFSAILEHAEFTTLFWLSLIDENTPKLTNIYSKYFENIALKLDLLSQIEKEINEIVNSSLKLNMESINYIESNSIDKISYKESVIRQLPDNIIKMLESTIDFFMGLILGRWDLRLVKNSFERSHSNGIFQPLPTSPPGILQGENGLPAIPNSIISEEWLRARPDANSLPSDGSVKNPTIRDEEYPIRISWQGILVDDAFAAEGNTHQEDILRRTREVIEVLWKERAPAIEQEACEILGVKSLRDYFRKPGGFFQDHLKRYSKSRRQAPIYWPLSSENGNYTLWIYYHRLTDQFLYTCVNDYVNPRIEEVTRDIEQFQKRQLADAIKSADSLKQLEALQDFLIELKNFRDELLAVAQLPYKPDLNDGVIITAAPLWKLFRLPKWRKDLKACWEKLQAGDYDWAHLTLAIWPDRVRTKCVTDKSLAIAHDLEHLYDESRAPKRKRTSTLEEENEEENIENEN